MTDPTLSPAAAPESFWASKRRVENTTKVIVTIVLIIGAVVMMLPIFWMLVTSFKDRISVFAMPPSDSNFFEKIVYIFHGATHPENYHQAWIVSGNFAGEDWRLLQGFYPKGLEWNLPGITFHGVTFTTYLLNTLLIAIFNCIGVTISSSLVAFAFARLRFPLRGPLFIICLATMMVPTQVTMIPTFILFKSLHWVDTFYPLIVPAFLGGGAYNIFLMRQFFMSIPYEMDEAAKIDGCSNFGVYLAHPAAPLQARPGHRGGLFLRVQLERLLEPPHLPGHQRQEDPGPGLEEFRLPLRPGLPPAHGGFPADLPSHSGHVPSGPEILHPGHRHHGA